MDMLHLRVLFARARKIVRYRLCHLVNSVPTLAVLSPERGYTCAINGRPRDGCAGLRAMCDTPTSTLVVRQVLLLGRIVITMADTA
jgi:hypothetical protein